MGHGGDRVTLAGSCVLLVALSSSVMAGMVTP